ncbi:hypothetical protein ACPOL_3926 [Acidisarcina polymorpha]|uniref:Uncharacterized protein n=1 Tax=Acidisarcina polymorpha TaxID=2211140 RepID=A0A2Z5G3K0_9BACT|nr:hypothetical protein ACPOL_3926 [Acidisarcina polymorpha]
MSVESLFFGAQYHSKTNQDADLARSAFPFTLESLLRVGTNHEFLE